MPDSNPLEITIQYWMVISSGFESGIGGPLYSSFRSSNLPSVATTG